MLPLAVLPEAIPEVLAVIKPAPADKVKFTWAAAAASNTLVPISSMDPLFTIKFISLNELALEVMVPPVFENVCTPDLLNIIFAAA